MEEIKLEKEIYNLKLKNQGLMLEYQYVNDLKNQKIEELRKIIQEENQKKEEIENRLNAKNNELKSENSQLKEENDKLKEEMKKNIKAYENSTSWRVTKPLRFLGKIIKK